MRKNVPPIPAYQRVLRRTKVPKDKDKCWLWKGPVNNAGYGMIRGNNSTPKMVTVHRAMGEHVGLDIQKEIQHTCLNKICVNPRHLVNGDSKTRKARLTKKYGRAWMRPKKIYYKCQHCGGKTIFTWFNRKHNDCYPGMKDTKFTCNKV